MATRANIINRAFAEDKHTTFPLNTAYGVCNYMQMGEEVVERGIAMHASYAEAFSVFQALPGNIAVEDYTTSLCGDTQLWIAQGMATTLDNPPMDISFASHFYFIPCVENTYDAAKEQYYIAISKAKRVVFYTHEHLKRIVLYNTKAEAEAKCMALLLLQDFPPETIERDDAPHVHQVNFHTPQEGYALIVKSTHNIYRQPREET